MSASEEPDPGQVGRKAFTLHQLLRAGFPVPPGICISTAVFREALSPLTTRIQGVIVTADLNRTEDVRKAAERVAALLDNLALPGGLMEEITEALPPSPNGLYAVRSSALDEDGADSSLAGQYHTTLGVKSADLGTAILACWRAYFFPNALAARARHTNPSSGTMEDPGMAVLVQPLLDAECAGVCFSVDPVRERPDLLMIASAWGLGAGVVNGTVPSDTTRLRRIDLGLEESSIADKDVRLCADPAGGLRREAVPPAERKIACLPPEWQERVAQFTLAAEQELGEPQDVEWCIGDGKVWILQSRPITTLPVEVRQAARFPVDWATAEEPRHFWQLERINARSGAVLLPSEIEFMRYRTIGGQTAVETAGFSKTRWRKYINGRVYIAVADSPLSPGECRVRGAAMDDLFERLQDQNVTIWEHWGPEIERATRRLAAFDGQTASGPALADHLEDAMAAAQRHWMVHTLVPRRGRLTRLSKAYQRLTGKTPEETDDELSHLLQGVETAQTRLVEALYRLACLAGETPPVAAHIVARDPDALTWLSAMPEASTFMNEFGRFMLEYGDRVCYRRMDGESVELPSTWQEAPERVLEMIAAYLPAGDEAVPSPIQARENAARDFKARIDALCGSARDPSAVADFLHWLDFTRRNAAFTDDHNHYIDQLAEGQYVQALLYAGQWLTARGDLNHPVQVFWLETGEVLSALRVENKQDFNETIASRKEQFARWCRMYAPATMGVPDAALPDRPAESSTQDESEQPQPLPTANSLLGQPASRGRRLGRARIVSETDPLPVISPGDVLVAVDAGPQWTPLFPILSGIVLDSGSPGDHAAITAREYGLPAVFAVREATRRIPNGARVAVDGDQGLVTWTD